MCRSLGGFWLINLLFPAAGRYYSSLLKFTITQPFVGNTLIKLKQKYQVKVQILFIILDNDLFLRGLTARLVPCEREDELRRGGDAAVCLRGDDLGADGLLIDPI